MISMAKSFVKWLDITANWSIVLAVLVAEAILIAAMFHQPNPQLNLERTIPAEKLEYRTLPIPQTPSNFKPQPRPIISTRPAVAVIGIANELIQKLIRLESNGVDSAKGDYRNGQPQAHGCLQIWEDYVGEVNSIFGTRYTHQDMFVREHAVDVCTKYLGYWGRKFQLRHGRLPTDVELAAIHNAGPRGYSRKESAAYVAKFKRI